LLKNTCFILLCHAVWTCIRRHKCIESVMFWYFFSFMYTHLHFFFVRNYLYLQWYNRSDEWIYDGCVYHHPFLSVLQRKVNITIREGESDVRYFFRSTFAMWVTQCDRLDIAKTRKKRQQHCIYGNYLVVLINSFVMNNKNVFEILVDLMKND
jgi:hypothetical protein